MLYRDMNHTQRRRDSFNVSPACSPSSARVACIVTSTTSSAANSSSNCLQIKKITLAYSNPFAKQQQQQRRGNC